MAAALPITKLASLLVKTLSKPMAKRIKHEFSRYPFTQNILISIGQTTHQVTSRMTIWSAGYKVRSITPLESEKALSKGADFLGESIVFLMSGTTVIYEYNRSKAKEKQKEALKLKEMQDESDRLQKKLNALDTRLMALEKVLKAKNRSMLNFGERYVEPEVNVVIDDRPNRGAAVANMEDGAEGSQSKVSNDISAAHQIETPFEVRQNTSPDSPQNTSTANLKNDQSGDKSQEGVDSHLEANKNTKPKSQRWGWWGWWPF